MILKDQNTPKNYKPFWMSHKLLRFCVIDFEAARSLDVACGIRVIEAYHPND